MVSGMVYEGREERLKNEVSTHSSKKRSGFLKSAQMEWKV